MVSKWLKVAVLAFLLMGAGYFFGAVCKQIGQAYELLLFPSGELLNLLLWFLLAWGSVAVTAGLVAALVRPVWVGIIVFVLSGLAMLLGWQVATINAILVLVYALFAALYAVGVARELDERVRFSVRPIGEGQGMLLMALVLVACGSLYVGVAAHIEREGFSIPEPYIEMFVEQMERRTVASMSEEEREAPEFEAHMAELRDGIRRNVNELFEHTLKPYEWLIPLAVAVGLFMSLLTITRLLNWIPTVVLSAVFPLLTALGVTRVVSETREVHRLVIGPLAPADESAEVGK
jgi:ABC-type multidrug transport system fused ATPase/permease subunit